MQKQALVGWRARMGLLIPHQDHLTEPILCRLLPEGISFHVARFKREGPISKEGAMEMNTEELDSAIDRLPARFLDLIVYHCTGGSFLMPPESINERIETRSGVQAINTSMAVIEALNEVEAEKISLVAPYPREITDAAVEFLETRGYHVLKVDGQEIDDSGTQQHTAPEEIALWAKRANTEQADCIFISCTGIRSVEVVDELEHDLEKPVIVSTTAMIWQALNKLNIKDPIPGYGQLLA